MKNRYPNFNAILNLMSEWFRSDSGSQNLSPEERYFKTLLKNAHHNFIDVRTLKLENINHIHPESSTTGEDFLILQTDIRPKNCFQLRVIASFPSDIKGADKFRALMKKLKFNLVALASDPVVPYGYNPKKYAIVEGSVSPSALDQPICDLINRSQNSEKVIIIHINEDSPFPYVKKESQVSNPVPPSPANQMEATPQ
ncbi:MAG: hypothetical protein WBK55_05030 [Alphaproteobacteria bacterium]